jgi:arylsulfatase A-like enzyme
MDALAARGTRFTQRFYALANLCACACSALATGQMGASNIAYWDNAMGYDGRMIRLVP